MTDADQVEGGGEPRKKGFPSWLWWGCGGGCLLMTLIAGVLVVLVGGVVRDAFDPEKAWADVHELMAFDERPSDWLAHGTTRMGRGVYVLKVPHDSVVLILQRFDRPAELDAMFDPNASEHIVFSIFDSGSHPELGTIQLQGRETRCLRFSGGLGHDEQNFRSGILIDIAGSGTPTLLQIQLRHTEEPVSAEQVAELLTPFDVWRGR